MAERPPIWIFLAVAAAIAIAAFAVGQVVDSAGMIFALAVSLAWCCTAQGLWGRKIRG